MNISQRIVFGIISLLVLAAGGIVVWQFSIDSQGGEQTEDQKEQKTEESLGSESPGDTLYTIKSPDGFSLQIYKEGTLYANIPQVLIESQYHEKYPDASLDMVWGRDRRFISPPSFFWDEKRNNLIIPIPFAQVSGSSNQWEFFVFAIDSKEFSIIQEESRGPRVGILPSAFELSPNGDRLAYVDGGAGGTCTYRAYPAVLDLVTLRSLHADDSMLFEARSKYPLQEGDIYQYIKEMRWVSDNQISANMFLDCGHSLQEEILFEVRGWHTFRNEKFEFKYPAALGDYVYLDLHPNLLPTVTIEPVAPNFSCEDIEDFGDLLPRPHIREEITFNGTEYCVVWAHEGAAGSIYSTYKYASVRSTSLFTLEFTMRFPTACTNYDAYPDRVKKCEEEVREFNPTALADQILSTLRFIE